MPDTMTEETGEPRETVHVSDDARYRILANERRRVLLDVLEDADLPIALDDLAASVSEREGRSKGDDHVVISLHHKHLPLMDSLGVLEYSPGANAVTDCRVTLASLLC